MINGDDKISEILQSYSSPEKDNHNFEQAFCELITDRKFKQNK